MNCYMRCLVLCESLITDDMSWDDATAYTHTYWNMPFQIDHTTQGIHYSAVYDRAGYWLSLTCAFRLNEITYVFHHR